MLNANIKQQINTARDILVGKIPDPKGQIDQITNALIYKFMDDQDRLALTLPGGKANFFVNELKPYAWHKLFDGKLSNQDKANLYVEGIAKLSVSKHLPDLFRDIFKDAFLPFRAPDTIAMFLGEINKFDYKHSEDLGNAFEYLLSFLSVQGDLGSFRTPRNIIEFIVDAVDPNKDDHILDPACGTAGFLVEAYKHITKDKKLTPNEIQELAQHIHGVDIDPGMAKIARVNLYLHGFKTPLITEDDTLSDERLWGKKYDVILANPPFMTPKGGIVPHDKFSVKSIRAEVLFTDYIAEHLKLAGRAGVVIPEGIIFQSGKVYKKLRKMLVDDNYLWAVVSLPAGVFNPYSGVKTSILLFDRERSAKNTEILFFKVNNDGFDLGAQRREISKNDLPEALEILKKWKNNEKVENSKAIYIKKEKIAETGDYNLTGERYKETKTQENHKWKNVKVSEIIDLNFGTRITKKNDFGSKYPVYGGGGESFRTDDYNRENEMVISRFAMSEICVRFVAGKFFMLDSGFTYSIKPEKQNEVLKEYIDRYFLSKQSVIYGCSRGNAQKNLDVDRFKNLEIPLPPIEVQKEIVEQIEVKQNAIDHAKAIIQNLERERRYFGQALRKLEGVEMFRLGEICDVRDGTHDSPKFVSTGYPLVTSKNVKNNAINFEDVDFISEDDYQKIIKRSGVDDGDIIMPMIGTIGSPIVVKKDRDFAIKNVALIKFAGNASAVNFYVKNILASDLFENYIKEVSRGGTQKFISLGNIRDFQIPLPSLEIQKKLVDEAEKEQVIINANKQLIEIMEQKISDVLSEI